MTGDAARRNRVIYLEYSSVEIQAKDGGRKWKVYGCPVCPNVYLADCTLSKTSGFSLVWR